MGVGGRRTLFSAETAQRAGRKAAAWGLGSPCDACVLAPVSPSHPPRPLLPCAPSLPSLHPRPSPDPDAPLSWKTGPLLNLQSQGNQIAGAPGSAGTQGPHLQHGGANAHQEAVTRVPEGHPPPHYPRSSPRHEGHPPPYYPRSSPPHSCSRPSQPIKAATLTSRLDSLATWDKVDIPQHRGPGPRGSAGTRRPPRCVWQRASGREKQRHCTLY